MDRKKLEKKQEQCWRNMKAKQENTGETCPGKASNQRQFCFVEEKCFKCKHWT